MEDNVSMAGTYGVLWLIGSLMIAGAPTHTTQVRDRPWERSASLCGVSFKLGNDWVAERDSGSAAGGQCRGVIKHRRYDTLVGHEDPSHFWTIAVAVAPRSFEATMDLHEIRREGHRWFVGEGAREAPAYEVKGPGWWGLRVDELAIRSGPRIGAGSFESEATWVLISGTTGGTVTLLAGEGADRDALPLLLNSLTFDPRR
jgi:hypothetical protein